MGRSSQGHQLNADSMLSLSERGTYLLLCLWSSSSSVSLLMVMMLTAGLGVSGMTMVCLGMWCWCCWSRVVLHVCSGSLAPQPLPPQLCGAWQLETEPFWSTAQRGGVFSFTRLERCGDSTTWEDETSYAEAFLTGRKRRGEHVICPGP